MYNNINFVSMAPGFGREFFITNYLKIKRQKV